MTAVAPNTQLSAAPVGAHAQEAARRRAVTVVLTFVTVVVGLWAILGYVSKLSDTLVRVNSINERLQGQMESSNEGLAQLDTSTAPLSEVADDSVRLGVALTGIQGDMDAMLAGVSSLGTQMASLESTFGGLGPQLQSVGATNDSIGSRLGGLNDDLASQRTQVRALSGSLNGTARDLGKLPRAVDVTAERLAYINRSVCSMGRLGLRNQINIRMSLLGIPNGTANVAATIIPPGGWRCG